MKKFIDFIRAFFISFELVIIILSILLYNNDFLIYALIGERIRDNVNLWNFTPTLPFIFTAAIFRYSNRILSPVEKYNKILYKWPHYGFLKNRVYISYFYGIMSCLASIFVLILKDYNNLFFIGALISNSILVSGVTAITNLIAAQKIKEIMTLNIDE
jgi:hypothetical protein